MWFNEYKRMVTNEGEKPLTPIMGLFGGMSAGCFSTLGNNPFDVVKVLSEFSLCVSLVKIHDFIYFSQNITLLL